MRTSYLNIFIALVLLAGCSSLPARKVFPTGTAATLPPPAVVVHSMAASSPTPAPLPTTAAAFTETAVISATPDPYRNYSIDYLVGRSYGGGELVIEETLAENSAFTRALISYPSDGLTIYGFMDLPKRVDGALPVIIALHGYIEPTIYNTLDYTTRYADDLARAGFLVVHPNLRGYKPSDDGDNLFRVGMAVDVLNLLAIVRDQAGKPGALEKADGQRIGLWGHSMGGGIATRVMTVSPDISAVLLYGAMSADDRLNYERIFSYFSNGTRGIAELDAPESAFTMISPINYLERIQAAVSIHHGEEDPDVPLAWSEDLCQRLRDLEKQVECFVYKDQAHTFHGDGDVLFIQRSIDFYRRVLR